MPERSAMDPTRPIGYRSDSERINSLEARGYLTTMAYIPGQANYGSPRNRFHRSVAVPPVEESEDDRIQTTNAMVEEWLEKENVDPASVRTRELTEDYQDHSDSNLIQVERELGPDFCSLGRLCFDRIVVGKEILIFLAGEGLYASLGARMVLQGSLSKGLLWPMKFSSLPGFPQEDIESSLGNNGVTVHWLDGKFGEYMVYDYYYNEEKKQRRIIEVNEDPTKLEPAELDEVALGAKVFHIVCSPMEAVARVEQLLGLLTEEGDEARNAMIVWQPMPGTCKKGTNRDFVKVCSMVDAIVVGYKDLISAFDFFIPHVYKNDSEYVRKVVEKACQATLNVFQEETRNGGLKGTIVAFCDEFGAFVFGHPKSFQEQRSGQFCRYRPGVALKRRAQWLPPFYHPQNNNMEKVVEISWTAATFAGAFCAFISTVKEEYTEAAIFGSVAASFTMEGISHPLLTYSETEEELWNGESFLNRLNEYYTKVLGKTRNPKKESGIGKPLTSLDQYRLEEWEINRGPDKLFKFQDPRAPIYRDDLDSDSDNDGPYVDTVVMLKKLEIRKDSKPTKGQQHLQAPKPEVTESSDQELDARILHILTTRSTDEAGPVGRQAAVPRIKYELLDLDTVGPDYLW